VSKNFVSTPVAIGKWMLVGRSNDVLQLIGRKTDGMPLVPLEDPLSSFVFGQPETPELGSKTNGAVVPIPRLDVGLPDSLDSGAGKFEPAKIRRGANTVFEWLTPDPFHL
jgi:hypothetical protein